MSPFDLFREMLLLGCLAIPLDDFFRQDALPATELVVVPPTLDAHMPRVGLLTGRARW
jgi:hypothetical protein